MSVVKLNVQLKHKLVICFYIAFETKFDKRANYELRKIFNSMNLERYWSKKYEWNLYYIIDSKTITKKLTINLSEQFNKKYVFACLNIYDPLESFNIFLNQKYWIIGKELKYAETFARINGLLSVVPIPSVQLCKFPIPHAKFMLCEQLVFHQMNDLSCYCLYTKDYIYMGCLIFHNNKKIKYKPNILATPSISFTFSNTLIPEF